MRNSYRNFFGYCCVAACALLAACALQSKHRGFIFSADFEEQLAKVKTSADLTRQFGSPQAETLFGDKVWIYYGADEKYRGPLPVTYENKTALLAWIKDGKVSRTQVLRGDDFPDMWIDRDETPIPAAVELNALEELVNNIGRYTPSGLGH